MLDLIASICDTKRVASLPEKMVVLKDLLFTNGIRFGILGGATNRIALLIDGYAMKFAMDAQGYRDNLVEYSICEELQPYVTKAYETNGYILVAECVRTMTQESEFVARKQDMLNILLVLADDYLLGDVGYLKKNMTNWGIRDNGELVILDYAYCHRATEKLFTCPVCGEGVLTYDHVFDKLICTNKSVCHATFTYNQRKSEQGDQVDLDMIEERKKSSIVLQEDESFVEVGDNISRNRIINESGKKVVIVNNISSYYKMKEGNKMINKNFDSEEAMDLMVKLALAQGNDSVEKQAIVQDLNNLRVSEDIEYVMDDEYQTVLLGKQVDDEPLVDGPYEESDDNGDDEDYSLDALVQMVMNGTNSSEEFYNGDEQREVLDNTVDEKKTDLKLGVILDGVEL